MKQRSSANGKESSPQLLANATIAGLAPPADKFELRSPLSDLRPFVPIEAYALGDNAPTNAASDHHDSSSTAGQNEPQINAEPETRARPLPSLLQYVDHVLMRDKARHNHPLHTTQSCVSCNKQWDKAGPTSTFLPLSPCNHWIHYRCLIWLATRDGSHKDKCCACDNRLFEWDGISALTLATRTSVPMGNKQDVTLSSVTCDRTDYEQDCHLIDIVITRCFFHQLAKPTSFRDNSPDLVQCYNTVLDDLRSIGRPRSRWLTFGTSTGSLLFGMLVAIKMRGFLVEDHERIRQTEAWIAWEDGCRWLQGRILEDVHKE